MIICAINLIHFIVLLKYYNPTSLLNAKYKNIFFKSSDKSRACYSIICKSISEKIVIRHSNKRHTSLVTILQKQRTLSGVFFSQAKQYLQLGNQPGQARSFACHMSKHVRSMDLKCNSKSRNVIKFGKGPRIYFGYNAYNSNRGEQ